MSVIEGGVVIEGGIPRSLNPFATIRRVPSGVTIQSVVDVAVAGDIIAIEPGDYVEAVSVVDLRGPLGGKPRLVQSVQNGRAAHRRGSRVWLAWHTATRTNLPRIADFVGAATRRVESPKAVSRLAPWRSGSTQDQSQSR